MKILMILLIQNLLLKLETNLDKIADGEKWVKVLDDFYPGI